MPLHNYQYDRQWADRYQDQVLRILAGLLPHLVLLCVASQEKDRKQATDFEVRMKGGAIAVRLRNADSCRGHRDLTIRSCRDSGEKTELAKIKEGYASHYFYGWISEGIITEWVLVHLGKVRTLGLLEKKRTQIPNRAFSGKLDGTYFIAIPVDELRCAGCVLAEFPVRQRNVKTEVSEADIESGIERARQRKLYRPQKDEGIR